MRDADTRFAGSGALTKLTRLSVAPSDQQTDENDVRHREGRVLLLDGTAPKLEVAFCGAFLQRIDHSD
jgi:hypothetical protein